MKISPMPAFTPITEHGNPQPSRAESVRSIKMATNATPMGNENPGLPILDNNGQTDAGNEATKPLSPQLAMLARQRRELQRQKQEFEAQKRAFQDQSGKPAGIEISRLKSEPLSVLLENGVTYDQLTEAIMASPNNSEVNALKAELAALKASIDQQFVQRDTAAEKQVYAEMHRNVRQIVSQGTDYELVRETKSVPLVMNLIERTYRETGEVLDESEACRLVEAELFKDVNRIVGLSKVRSQFEQQMAPIPPQPRQQVMRTLTNRDTASVPLSRQARAIAAFHGTLKR